MSKEAPPGKQKAVICYITFVGLLIAMSMNSNEKHPFATIHIKNMFGITLLWISAKVFVAYINLILGEFLFWTAVVLLVYSLVRAIQDKKPNIPFLSEKFDEWFTFLD
ncbi:hypothetical protein SCB49_10797 [unidentified eubacterium SCB49]|nr:hypothetical protein SCB49_10797 [unidentified eubacterium SCB49]